jgi:hypothetical protein
LDGDLTVVEHVNFYENIAEAHQRLLNTLITYDGVPHKVVAITDHREKGKIFSIYMLPIPFTMGVDYPPAIERYRHGSNEQGIYLDDWIKGEGENCKLVRKHMNSPKFNRFRPFPLGMINEAGSANFLQRQPQRTRESGMSRASILQSEVTIDGNGYEGVRQNSIDTKEMRDCILGVYPTFKECVAQLRKPDIINSSVAFDRNFAIIRGPLDLFFLNYKAETIGLIEEGDKLLLGRDFKYYREVIEELGVFSRVVIQS